jgi:hypothetical protein
MAKKGANQFYIDKKDIKLALKDLGRLGTDVTKKQVVRRALKTAGADMKKQVERNAFKAIMDHGEMAESFRFRSGTRKKGYLSIFIRSIPKYGGNLTKIFEDGTKDRFTKSGWWTGKIDDGQGKTVPHKINTKFIQRGFNQEEASTSRKILKHIKIQVDKVVAKSKKLNKKI